MSDDRDLRSWIFWPAVITLAVTLLRVFGEIQEWDSDWFGRSVGGQAGSGDGGLEQKPGLVGITWLAPLFGLWFGLRLTREGRGPAHRGRALLFPLLGFAICIGGFALVGRMMETVGEGPAERFVENRTLVWYFLGFFALSWVGAVVARRGWEELWRVTLAYGWAARIPVVLVTYVLCVLDLGTHYEKPHPSLPSDYPMLVKATILSVAQVGFWVPFTIFSGMLFGGLAALFVRPGPAQE